MSLNDELYVAGEVIVALLATVGNILVVYVFCTNRRLRSYRNYYILGLAIADCFIGSVGVPLAILASQGLPRNLYGCLFTCSLIISCCIVSILCLLAVSIDRFWATFNSVSYYNYMSAKIANGILAVCTLLGTLLGMLPMFGWYNESGWDETQGVCRFDKIMDYDYLVFKYFTAIVFPGILIAGFYGYIYQFIRSRRPRKQYVQPGLSVPNDRSDDSNEEPKLETEAIRNDRAKRREARAGKKLSSIIVFFWVCWMPLNTLNCIKAFWPSFEAPFELIQFTIILSHANSAINPLLYAYHLKEFRTAMKAVLCPIVAVMTCRTCTGAQRSSVVAANTQSQTQSFIPPIPTAR